jgi:hypothetical protein
LGYIAIANAAPVIGHSLAQLPGSNGAHVTVALGYAVAAVAVATLAWVLIPRLQHVALRAAQRLLFLTTAAWLLTVAVDLARLTS